MRNAVVVGSGRNGTSMLTGAIAGAGYFVGDDPYPANESNPKGFFEARDINGINEALLASVEPRGGDLRAWQRWLAIMPLGLDFKVAPVLRERMQRLTARQPFCFKDPRFCYTLPAWRDVLGDARFLVVFRSPSASATSIVQEWMCTEYLSNLKFDFERATKLWTAMYRHVLDVHRHQGEWLFVHFDQVLTPAGQGRIETFLEAPLARDFPEPRLRRSSDATPVSSEAAEIYARLCELAGFDGPPVSVHRRARSAASSARATDRQRELPMSVIVCTHDRQRFLAECVESFERQTTAHGSFELVIVDDGSTDGTGEWLDNHRFTIPARVVRLAHSGLAAARNAGVGVARGRYLLLVNDDTIAFPNLVEEHLACHRELSDDKVSVLGTFEQPERVLDGALMRALEESVFVLGYAGLKSGEFYDWDRFWTCNVSVPRELVTSAGGFDERFLHLGCADVDLAVRLSRLGGRVYFHSAARAQHRHVLDFDALESRQRAAAQAWVSLFTKHPALLDHKEWHWVRGLDIAACDRLIDERRPALPSLERAARELAKIDVGALDTTVPVLARVSKTIVSELRATLSRLNEIWWLEGFVRGFTEHHVTSFADLTPPEPWPLATRAANVVIAWPDWTREDLDRLLDEYGGALAGRADTCLVLRHDVRVDPSPQLAQATLAAAYSRRFPAGESIDVLVLDDMAEQKDARRVGRVARAALSLPSSTSPDRRAWLAALHVELVTRRASLERRLPLAQPAPPTIAPAASAIVRVEATSGAR